MGDSTLATWLSAVPLLITIVAAVVGALAWRYGRRAVRTVVALLLILVGAAALFFPGGPAHVAGGWDRDRPVGGGAVDRRVQAGERGLISR